MTSNESIFRAILLPIGKAMGITEGSYLSSRGLTEIFPSGTIGDRHVIDNTIFALNFSVIRFMDEHNDSSQDGL